MLSQLTATRGGSQTHTLTETEGHTVTDTIAVGWRTGWTDEPARPRRQPERVRADPAGRRAGPCPGPGPPRSWAEGTNWSNAAASQRVYEYAVEPPVLQHLPDHALLLVTRGPGPVPAAGGMRPRHRHPAPRQRRPLPDPARPLPQDAIRAPSVAHVSPAAQEFPQIGRD